MPDIVPVTPHNADVWAQLCHELWPHHSAEEMLADFAAGRCPHEYLALEDGIPAAFLSLSIRTEYVEGKTGYGPVGYMEGIYVHPRFRNRGIASAMVGFARVWSARQGCMLLASDCELKNTESRQFHNRIGFTEAGINVHFLMPVIE